MTEKPEWTAVGQGAFTYVLWGLVPLFWPLLAAAGAVEILANRIIWSFVLVVVWLLLLRTDWRWLRDLGQVWPRLLLAAIFIGANWGVFIWAVNSGHVAETSLGYFINPLLNVVLGALIFKERPAPVAWVGIGLAAIGVIVIAFSMQGTIWVALVLAVSFATYGVLKKGAKVGALQGLTVESAVLLLPALGYVLWLGGGRFVQSPTDALFLVLAGPVTAVPLWLFAKAAPRIPLGMLGMLQYIAPTMTLLESVFWFRQSVPVAYWFGLGLIWLGTLAYLASLWLRTRTRHRPERKSSARGGPGG